MNAKLIAVAVLTLGIHGTSTAGHVMTVFGYPEMHPEWVSQIRDAERNRYAKFLAEQVGRFKDPALLLQAMDMWLQGVELPYKQCLDMPQTTRNAYAVTPSLLPKAFPMGSNGLMGQRVPASYDICAVLGDRVALMKELIRQKTLTTPRVEAPAGPSEAEKKANHQEAVIIVLSEQRNQVERMYRECLVKYPNHPWACDTLKKDVASREQGIQRLRAAQ